MAVLETAQAKKAAGAVSSNLKLDKVKEGVAGFAPKVCTFFGGFTLSFKHPVFNLRKEQVKCKADGSPQNTLFCNSFQLHPPVLWAWNTCLLLPTSLPGRFCLEVRMMNRHDRLVTYVYVTWLTPVVSGGCNELIIKARRVLRHTFDSRPP